MDMLITLLLKFTFVIAVYVFIIRAVSSWIPPSRLSNRFLGKAISLVLSIIAAKAYLSVIDQFFAFPERLELLLFVVFLTGNMVIAAKIFSHRKKRIINYGKPTATRPSQPFQRYKRP